MRRSACSAKSEIAEFRGLRDILPALLEPVRNVDMGVGDNALPGKPGGRLGIVDRRIFRALSTSRDNGGQTNRQHFHKFLFHDVPRLVMSFRDRCI